jgi:hypothetical protein
MRALLVLLAACFVPPPPPHTPPPPPGQQAAGGEVFTVESSNCDHTGRPLAVLVESAGKRGPVQLPDAGSLQVTVDAYPATVCIATDDGAGCAANKVVIDAPYKTVTVHHDCQRVKSD